MKKKIIVISIITTLSFLSASTCDSFVTNAEVLIPFLFTILGLCLTSYTFIYAPICEILKKESMKNDESRKKLEKLLNSFEEDMMLIFFLTIIILIVDFFREYDIPLVKNAMNIDLGVVTIKSLKEYFFNFIISISAGFSFFALYDLMQATFKILRKNFEN